MKKIGLLIILFVIVSVFTLTGCDLSDNGEVDGNNIKVKSSASSLKGDNYEDF